MFIQQNKKKYFTNNCKIIDTKYNNKYKIKINKFEITNIYNIQNN